MIYRLAPDYYEFPDPMEAEDDGLIAVGGDLSPLRLVHAYTSGIFPWFIHQGNPYWFSPDPRMVLFPDEFRYTKSLRRVVKSGKFEVKIDQDFLGVMHHCADTLRDDQDGTWLQDEFYEGYGALHKLGLAHSFETYYQGELVGGLYGVSLGRLFFGESMFHTMTDASKVAFVRLVEFCKEHHFHFIDAQQETPHLASLGARPIPRKEYLEYIDAMDIRESLKCSWHFFDLFRREEGC